MISRFIARVVMVGAAIALVSASDASAETCGGYAKYRWETLGTDSNGCSGIRIWVDFYLCDGRLTSSGNTQLASTCGNVNDKRILDESPDGSLVPGFDLCGDCPPPSPPSCGPLDPVLALAPHSAGCGEDERRCSSGSADSDLAPVRFSSGRVESRPITLFQLPSPDDVFFGVRLQWGSHITRTIAEKLGADSGPTIHTPDEDTYFIGNGWLDEFGDRLYVDMPGKSPDVIVWQRRGGSVTFARPATGQTWTSFGGMFELIDQADAYGRWLIRSTEPTESRRIWWFEQQDNIAPSANMTLGRLKRHAVVAPTAGTLAGRYFLD